MSMSMAEAQRIMNDPLYANREHIVVRMVDGHYTTEWLGQMLRSNNPFGLDSKLDEAGCPSPRSLYLISDAAY